MKTKENIKKIRNIEDHLGWLQLARKSNDLKFILLNYGHIIPEDAKISIQREYHKAEEECDELGNVLYDQGWVLKY